ncbi:hypothetical protein ACFWNQ_01665 [Streptomyces virginiae]|uniref:hypothetical protein n=1 Tax=Streptomyces virginiae TaxID=1961 RepID=UPI003660DA61
MLMELLLGAAVGFLTGLTTAWRIVAKGAAHAWLEDLRDRVKVRKTDRRKKQAINHAKLDQKLAAESAIVEAERKRVRRAHSELTRTLPLANEAVRTHTTSDFVRFLAGASQSFPSLASSSEADAELEKFNHHRAVIEQLRRQVEKLSSLGVDLKCSIKDWSEAGSIDLRTLADQVDKVTKDYALKI